METRQKGRAVPTGRLDARQTEGTVGGRDHHVGPKGLKFSVETEKVGEDDLLRGVAGQRKGEGAGEIAVLGIGR